MAVSGALHWPQDQIEIIQNGEKEHVTKGECKGIEKICRDKIGQEFQLRRDTQENRQQD